MYPLEKYRYYQAGNKVIAVSSYAGRAVRGVAKCNPKDVFDLEKGKTLAALRCNEKIAAKRFKRARLKCDEAAIACDVATTHYDNMIDYEEDAYHEWEEATSLVEDFLKEI